MPPDTAETTAETTDIRGDAQADIEAARAETAEEAASSIGSALRGAFDDEDVGDSPAPTEEVDPEALDDEGSADEDGEDSEDEDDSESDESEKEDEKKEDDPPKKETSGEKRRRKLKEANDRAETAETQRAEAEAKAIEAASFLREAERDVEAYEAFALSERARTQKLMEILEARNVTLSQGELAILELASQNAKASAQSQISESQKQATTAATKAKEQQTKQWAAEIRKTSDTWAEALNIPQDAMRNAIASAFKSGTLRSASDVGQVAKAIAAQAAAAAIGANGTAVHSAPNGQIKMAPRTIKPTSTTRPAYTKDLKGWKQSILDDPSI